VREHVVRTAHVWIRVLRALRRHVFGALERVLDATDEIRDSVLDGEHIIAGEHGIFDGIRKTVEEYVSRHAIRGDVRVSRIVDHDVGVRGGIEEFSVDDVVSSDTMVRVDVVLHELHSGWAYDVKVISQGVLRWIGRG